MTTSPPVRRLSLLILFALAALAAPVRAQEDIGTLHTNALTQMKMGEWAKALGYLQTAVDRYDKTAKTLFGSKFGWFWYHKGYCELKLRKYEEAQKSFETCYKKYPNDLEAQGGEGGAMNLYHIRSLLKWGEAAQGAKDYETAIRMYQRFLEERKADPARNPYEQGAFYINLAICHFKLNKIPQGLEHYETAIDNKETFPTPGSGIQAGFQAFTQAVIAKKASSSFFEFLGKYRAAVTLEPFEQYDQAPVFMQLAAAALESDLERVAFELYALVPSTRAVIADTQARLDALGSIDQEFPDGSKIISKERLETTRELARTHLSTGKAPEVTALAASAFIHETRGNARGAYAAYRQIEKYFGNSPQREDYLYHLVRTSSLIGEVLETESYGSRFLAAFPNSEYVEAVRALMLSSLFYDGEYEKCIEVAEVMIDTLPKPSDQHDICLHVLGGSYYYTGRYEDAQPKLDEHVEEYPKSTYRVASLYFQASNESRLQEWSKAASLLDAFLEKYPNSNENIYLPFALFDRASCHYALDEMEPALEKLTRVETEFPGADVMEMVYNLKGNVLQTLEKFAEAEEYYVKALELAERKGNDLVASEALSYLVGLLGAEKWGKEDNTRIAEALPYYEKFWEEYGMDSPYKPQVAVGGLVAMKQAGRGEEALGRLQSVIVDLASATSAFGLEEAINSYTSAYLEDHTPEELKEHYYRFPVPSRARAAQALLRIAIIGVFEEVQDKAAKEEDESTLRQARAMIKVLFQDLKNDFKPSELSTYILVNLGDFLREKTATPREALSYYEEVTERPDKSYLFPALFGIADIYGRSESPADNTKAIEQLKRIVADADNKSDRERALYRIVTVSAKLRDWEAVEKYAKEYLDRENAYREYAPWVSLLLAEAYDNRKMTEDALRAYTSAWAAYTGYIEVSAKAAKRILEITWQRDNPADPPAKADKQTAYEFGWKYIDSTRHIREGRQIREHEAELWDEVAALVQEFEDHPQVVDMETLKKQEEEARNR